MQNKEAKEILVFDKNGRCGKIIGFSTAVNAEKTALIDLGDEVQIVIPVQKLAPRKTTGFEIAGTFEEWRRSNRQSESVRSRTHENGDIEHGETISIPVIEEELEVQTRQVETGAVRVNKIVSEREEVIDQALSKERAKVERIPINRVVDEALNSRFENNTWIIPVYEEVVVVEKRLVLREEIRITKEISVEQHHERIPLRSETVTVDKSNEN